MIPIVSYGIYQLTKISKKYPEAKPLLALMGAFIFVVSALKLPSLFGSSSHPTGSGLAAVIFGPAIASVLSMIALIFQATLLAHGGLTTLGANVFSMGVVGPIVGFAVWVICRKARVPTPAGVFLAVALSDLMTYIVTSFQLALAFPSQGFFGAFIKFAAIFAVTQVPLAIAEGILAIFIFEFLTKYKGQILSSLKVVHIPVALEPEKSFQLKKKHYAILITILLILFVIPVFVLPSANLGGGTDQQGADLITSQGYTPWFNPVFKPPANLEPILFGVQAVIGATIIAYIAGREIFKRRVRARASVGEDPLVIQAKKHASHHVSHDNLCAQIDRYAYTNALSKISPSTKIFLATSMLLISVLAPVSMIPIVIFIGVSLLIVFYAEIPSRFYFNLLIYPVIVVVVSTLFIALFFGYGNPVAQVRLPWFTWTIYNNGIAMAASTFFRVLGALSSQYFLVLTTSMTDIFIVLKRLRFPKALIEISLLIYRYIFVFMEVTNKMMTAQTLRLGTSGWSKRIRSTSLLAGNLFIQSLEQGERTFIAMNARGYDGNYRVLEDLPKAKAPTIALIFVLDVFLVLLALNIINLGVL